MFDKDEEKGLAYDGRGVRKLMGDILMVVLAEFSTLSLAVLLFCVN
jgi:hypothetical protein